MSGRDWSSVKLPSFYEPPARRRPSQEEIDEYYKAHEQYGSDECVHVLADQWGRSTHEVKKIIEEIENSWL